MAVKQSWHAANGASVPSDITTSFTISAPPKTDIWRPDSSNDVFTAPYVYTSVQPSAFKRLSVTVSGPWKTLYDQGGLILTFPNRNGPIRWVKTGIEFVDGKPAVSVVGCDRFSDWSLCPMPEGEQEATFEAVKDGTTLWVYLVRDGKRQPLREVKWAFLDYTDEQQQHGEMKIGVCAAKPTPDERDAQKAIQVTFKNLEVELS